MFLTASHYAVANEKPINYLSPDDITNELIGSLSAKIKFAQTHVINANNNSEKEMSRLIRDRRARLIYIPLEDMPTKLTVSGYDREENHLGDIDMLPPMRRSDTDRNTTPNEMFPDVVYHDKAWETRLPYHWIQPGLRLVFSDQQNNKGELKNIDIGPFTSVLIPTFNVGMLTEPEWFNYIFHDMKAAKDYFQKLPTSQLTIAKYSPIHLEEIYMPSNVIYTDASAGDGGVYGGDMHNRIALKILATGITNANKGMLASPSESLASKDTNIYPAIKSRGIYANGFVRHGLHALQNIGTVYSMWGNEFSHEMGHTYGMWHYPGGGKWATQHREYGWGWDAHNNKYIANFYWHAGGNAWSNGYKTPPFVGKFQFNRDAMGGGVASSPISKYTLHTGFTQKRIQSYFEGRNSLTDVSPSGLIQNDKLITNQPQISQFGIPVYTLIGMYDPKNELVSHTYPLLTASYGHVFEHSAPLSTDCWLSVTYDDNTKDKFRLPADRYWGWSPNKYHINIPQKPTPIYSEVTCPKKENIPIAFTEWLFDKFDVDSFKGWSSDRIGTVEDVYGPYRGNYFKLTRSPYGYFPTGEYDTNTWKFVGNQNKLKYEFLESTVQTFREGFGEVLVTKRELKPSLIKPLPSVTVGGKYGYLELAAGAAFYSQADFQGDAAFIENDISNFKGKNVRSIKLGVNTKLMLFSEPNFAGDTLTLERNQDLFNYFDIGSISVIPKNKPHACIYSESNFKGKARCFYQQFDSVEFDYGVQSIELFNEVYGVNLYTGENLTGRKTLITSSQSSLDSMGNKIFSVAIAPYACLHQHSRYKGDKYCYAANTPSLIPNNDASSLSLYKGASATLFDTAEYTGNTRKITSDTWWLASYNDRASSLQVHNNKVSEPSIRDILTVEDGFVWGGIYKKESNLSEDEVTYFQLSDLNCTHTSSNILPVFPKGTNNNECWKYLGTNDEDRAKAANLFLSSNNGISKSNLTTRSDSNIYFVNNLENDEIEIFYYNGIDKNNLTFPSKEEATNDWTYLGNDPLLALYTANRSRQEINNINTVARWGTEAKIGRVYTNKQESGFFRLDATSQKNTSSNKYEPFPNIGRDNFNWIYLGTNINVALQRNAVISYFTKWNEFLEPEESNIVYQRIAYNDYRFFMYTGDTKKHIPLQTVKKSNRGWIFLGDISSNIPIDSKINKINIIPKCERLKWINNKWTWKKLRSINTKAGCLRWDQCSQGGVCYRWVD